MAILYSACVLSDPCKIKRPFGNIGTSRAISGNDASCVWALNTGQGSLQSSSCWQGKRYRPNYCSARVENAFWMPLWQICLIKAKNQTQTLQEGEIKMIDNLWPGDFLCHCGKLKQSSGIPGDGLFSLSCFPAASLLLGDQLLHHFGFFWRNAFFLLRYHW